MARPPRTQLGPVPNFTERGRQTYDELIGENTRRQGSRGAEEGSWRIPEVSGAFVGGVTSDQNDHAVYEVQEATGRGRYGSGEAAQPSWDQVDSATKAGFSRGCDDAAGWGPGFPHPVREGMNTHVLAPLPTGSERQRQSYQTATAPPNGGRGRVNPADRTLDGR